VEQNKIIINTGDEKNRGYKFDRVFDQDARQQDIYKGLKMQEMVQRVVEGYHATIFAYG